MREEERERGGERKRKRGRAREGDTILPSEFLN